MSDPLLPTFRTRLAAADPAAAEELRRHLDQRREVRGGHADWGRLCEEAGLAALAFREFQLAVRDEPHNPEAALPLDVGKVHRHAGLFNEPPAGLSPERFRGVERIEQLQLDLRQRRQRSVSRVPGINGF